MNVPVIWRISDARFSRTENRFERSSVYFHTGGLARHIENLSRHIRKPIPTSHRVSRSHAARLIDVARAALLVRDREMYPITYADPNHVTLYTLDRGLQIATYGIIPERRLLLEGLWGFLFLKNGYPLGYGCFSALFGSAEVSFNIFESFRRGESALTYAQLLRVIHHLTNATTFGVERYQFGYENEEAIKTGTFWFYYKLGFRPFGERTLRLIDRERSKFKSRKGYRSPPSVLEKLAQEHLFFHLGKPRKDVLLNAPFSKVGMAITRFIAERYDGDREKAVRESRRQAERLLGKLPRDRITSEFCLLMSVLSGTNKWPRQDRRSLADTIRARSGRGGDSAFVRGCESHTKLRRAVTILIR